MRAEPAVPPAATSEVAAKYGEQRLRQILAERLPQMSADTINRIAQGFEAHLHRSSRMFSDNFASGHMDDSELISRVSVFLHDNPGLLGRSAPAADDVGSRVRAALAARSTAPHTTTEGAALADGFLRNLSEHSRLAHQNLMSGRMSDEELSSRISVYLEDMRADTATAPGPDPAQVAAAALVADQFVRQNFGSSLEQAVTLVYNCSVTNEDQAPAQILQIMRRRPDNIRIHFLSGELVTLALGFDGTTAWMQRPSRSAEKLSAERAAPLIETAPFDHPLIGFRERGAQLTLRGGGPEPFELTVCEKDGRSVVSVIDPVSYQEIRQLVHPVSGPESELRFSDYRRFGPMNIACTQELWRSGARKSTTRLDHISTEATLLKLLFGLPQNEMVAYMDYMGGLALLQEHAGATATAKTGDNKNAPAARP